jgi:hypothetical protein
MVVISYPKILANGGLQPSSEKSMVSDLIDL